LSLGGKFSLITGWLRKLVIHAVVAGNFNGSIICMDPTSSKTGSQYEIHPRAMSRYPIFSPPKNFFPFISSSIFSIASLATFRALSCSSPLLHMAIHDASKTCYSHTYTPIKKKLIFSDKTWIIQLLLYQKTRL